MSFFTGALDSIAETFSPDYAKMKTQLQSTGESYETRGLIALVIGVALAILGIVLCATGNPLGAIPIVLSLPFFYFGYNNLMVGNNMQEIAKNPMEYSSNYVELKQAFIKNTIAYGWAIK